LLAHDRLAPPVGVADKGQDPDGEAREGTLGDENQRIRQADDERRRA
jgi:hypothetical protein